MLHRRDGARFLLDVMLGFQAKEFNLGFIRPDHFILMVWESLGALLETPSGLSCTEEWLPSDHSTIKAWLVECCRDGCPSGSFSYLLRGTLEFLVTSWSLPWPRPLLVSLAGRPALGWVLVVPNFFHLRMTEATVFLGTFNVADFFWFPSRDLGLDTILSQSSTDNSYNIMPWLFYGMLCILCDVI